MATSPALTRPPLPPFLARVLRRRTDRTLPVTSRLERHVRGRFGQSLHDQVLATLSDIELAADTASDPARVERIQTAAVVTSRGFLSVLLGQAELARIDWRSVLVNGGLADDDWPDQLDTLLGPLP